VSFNSRWRLSFAAGVLDEYPSFSRREIVADKVDAATPKCLASAFGLIPVFTIEMDQNRPVL
jgi:hypothetical protein